MPFSDGLEHLANLRGQRVVVLVSGDPFWFGAGTVLAKHFDAGEWTAHPGPSCFALAAARLGWALDQVPCIALHAAPLRRLRRHLAPGQRLFVTLRDGEAPAALAEYLTAEGWGQSEMTLLEHLGGPKERISHHIAQDFNADAAHPVVAALTVAGAGTVLTCATGQADDVFDHDGQITKRPIRAMTLSTLAPKPHEHLWDIGGGSGSIALEWVLSHATTSATTIEARTDRASRIRGNAEKLGLEHRLTVIEGEAPAALADLPVPSAIFVGGGLSEALLTALMTERARLVANAVTLESEALLTQAHAAHGGDLMRIALSHSEPLGRMRGWVSVYPVVQWSLER